MSNQEAVDLLVRHLGALPHPEYGVINLLPWSVDSDQTNALKVQICEAIVNVFADAGYPMGRQPEAVVKPLREVAVNCRLCSTPLMVAMTDENGVANVPAATMISSLAKRSPECPHNVLTADDQRRAIEQAVVDSMKRGNPREGEQ